MKNSSSDPEIAANHSELEFEKFQNGDSEFEKAWKLMNNISTSNEQNSTDKPRGV